MSRQPVAVALLHHPVLDRRGDVVTAAVTNLDLHDIARTARTYGVGRFFVITPVAEQRLLVERICSHWRQGHGASYNPHRGEALSLIEVASNLDEAIMRWGKLAGKAPVRILTGASRTDGMSFDACRKLAESHPLMLILGTGWGLAPELYGADSKALEPVRGADSYNHLPVRAAAAVILDRLLGQGRG